MTWMWKWGTSWKAASPSATNRLTPSTRRPEPRSARAMVSAITQQAAPSPGCSSASSWACRLGKTSRCPGTIGAMSMIAITVPSEKTTEAGACPSTIWQKTQSLTLAVLRGLGRVLASQGRAGRRLAGGGRGGRRLGGCLAGSAPARLGAVGRNRLGLSDLGGVVPRGHLLDALLERCLDTFRRRPVDDHRLGAGQRALLVAAAPPAAVLAPAVAAPGPGQPLDLRAHAHPLAGRDDGADAGHQPVGLGMLEEGTEELGRAPDHGLRVADYDEQLLGPGDGDVDPVGIVQEADRGAVVGTDQGEDDGVRFAALEGVHRFDVVGRHDALERAGEAVHLRVVHGDHGQLRLPHPLADDGRDVLAERHLELVGHRPLRIAILLLGAGVDPDQLPIEGPGQRHPRVWRLMDQLAVVKEVGDDLADRLPHPVLARQHDLRLRRDLVPHPAVEAVVADDLV